MTDNSSDEFIYLELWVNIIRLDKLYDYEREGYTVDLAHDNYKDEL